MAKLDGRKAGCEHIFCKRYVSKLTSTGTPHSRRQQKTKENVSANTFIDTFDDTAVEARLGKGTNETQEDSQCEELLSLAMSSRMSLQEQNDSPCQVEAISDRE